MSNFPVLNINTAPDKAKALLQQTQENFGFIPNLIGVMAISPAITEAYLSVAEIFSNSTLSPTEQQVVLLTVSHFHECCYCVAAHTVIASMQNVNSDIVQAIRDDQFIADSKLEALRKFTKGLIENRGWANEEDINSFLSSGYTETQILDILVGIAQKTLSNFTNHLAKTPLDDAFAEASWTPTA